MISPALSAPGEYRVDQDEGVRDVPGVVAVRLRPDRAHHLHHHLHTGPGHASLHYLSKRHTDTLSMVYMEKAMLDNKNNLGHCNLLFCLNVCRCVQWDDTKISTMSL